MHGLGGLILRYITTLKAEVQCRIDTGMGHVADTHVVGEPSRPRQCP
jgi:hypothetical protein